MTILLIGCGRMGSAMARGWAGKRDILAYDPGAAVLPDGVTRITGLDPATLPGELVVVLAVKPQIFPGLAPQLAAIGAGGGLVLSIMAGVPIAKLSAALSGSSRVVRAMPNTPASIGKGITAAVAGDGVSVVDRALVDTLLAATGAVVWLDEEGDLDVVTALSGSGPAYFFRFTEALARAGESAGLSAPLAMQLARATFTGAAALADADGAEALASLREQVTSPGGTTAAGLARMDAEDSVDAMARRVVNAAAARSRELAAQ